MQLNWNKVIEEINELNEIKLIFDYIIFINMTESKEIKRTNPEFSVINEKNELKKVDNEVSIMKNRVQLLRQQLQKEKDNIRKNKELTKEVIQKKIDVNRINRYVQKQKDNSEEQEKIEQLRQRNQSVRLSHQKQLEQIQKAIYLVKLDDARQAKNISMEHRRRLDQMERQFLSAQKEKKQKISDESARAKERYMKYWKQKLSSIYLEQAQTIADVQDQKEKRKQQLKELQEQQIKIMEEINKYHTQQVQTKKQYLAALSLPVKQVAEAMGEYEGPKSTKAEDKKNYNRSSLQIDHVSQMRTIDRGGLRLPNTHVNQAKLKIILKQLKKIDRQKSSFSARDSN